MIRFSFPGPPGDYLGRLSRLRWRRAFAAVAETLDGVLEIADPEAVAAPGAAEALAAAAQRRRDVYPLDSASAGDTTWSAPPVETMRELEEASSGHGGEIREIAAPPERWPARFVPARRAPGPPVVAGGFRVLRADREFPARSEIVARIPKTARRLLDIGCGSGETAAAAARAIPGLAAVGIDRRDSRAPARSRLAGFHRGDALEVMEGLASRGERFDAFLFADVLEHAEDPPALLAAARAIADPAAALVVSVPNAASAALVGDLLAGRFDPAAAGPEDAGHLRWFTRASLVELLEESGCSGIAVVPGPMSASGDLAERFARAGVPYDPAQLAPIQWIATARFPEAR